MNTNQERNRDKHSLINETLMTFDPGDPANGSLYLCDLSRGSEPDKIAHAIRLLKSSKLWSDVSPKQVEEAQKPLYAAQLEMKDIYVVPASGLILARFDHPRFPSNPNRFEQWKAAISTLANT